MKDATKYLDPANLFAFLPLFLNMNGKCKQTNGGIHNSALKKLTITSCCRELDWTRQSGFSHFTQGNQNELPAAMTSLNAQ